MNNTIWIINGPNLNLLGRREPHIYGNTTFESYFAGLKQKFTDLDLQYFQSNHEGAIIDQLQKVGFSCRGIVMNPAAYTHTSIALADTVSAIDSPVVEVHISNIYEREAYRHHSYIKEHCIASIIGHGLLGYDKAIEMLIQRNEQ